MLGKTGTGDVVTITNVKNNGYSHRVSMMCNAQRVQRSIKTTMIAILKAVIYHIFVSIK